MINIFRHLFGQRQRIIGRLNSKNEQKHEWKEEKQNERTFEQLSAHYYWKKYSMSKTCRLTIDCKDFDRILKIVDSIRHSMVNQRLSLWFHPTPFEGQLNELQHEHQNLLTCFATKRKSNRLRWSMKNHVEKRSNFSLFILSLKKKREKERI